MNRRNFMSGISTLAIGSSLLPISNLMSMSVDKGLQDSLDSFHKMPIDESIKDNDFWYWVREAYNVSPNIINLNNGGVSPQPRFTQEGEAKYIHFANEAPSYYMWRVIDQGREPLRENLAKLSGSSPEEIAINRNTTEGLNSIIFGLNLKAGDEVVLNKYDYPNMMNAWRQREKRDGIKLVWVDMQFPMEDEDEIANLYISKFTDKTKIVHITHVINWVGQVIPTQKIAEQAHKRGIEVIVDGAHSFVQMPYNIPDLGCDYYATSLHKWLCAPFGTGMMWVKKDKISKIWPLLSAPDPESDDIRKFENLGTRNMGKEMAIGYSIDFHNMITTQRKRERLLYLRNYWMNQLKDNPKVSFYNSFKPEFSCALANIKIEGKTGPEIDQHLWNKYKIHTVAIKYEAVDGVRITPNVYTSINDLDKLVRGLNELAS